MAAEEKKIQGIPYSHFDGYDGGAEPPQDFIAELLRGAPPEVQARAAEFAKQRATEAGDKKA
jgi:hypothetical protein